MASVSKDRHIWFRLPYQLHFFSHRQQRDPTKSMSFPRTSNSRTVWHWRRMCRNFEDAPRIFGTVNMLPQNTVSRILFQLLKRTVLVNFQILMIISNIVISVSKVSGMWTQPNTCYSFLMHHPSCNTACATRDSQLDCVRYVLQNISSSVCLLPIGWQREALLDQLNRVRLNRTWDVNKSK